MTMANFNVCVKAIWKAVVESPVSYMWIPQSGFSQRAYRELTNIVLSDLVGWFWILCIKLHVYMPYHDTDASITPCMQ